MSWFFLFLLVPVIIHFISRRTMKRVKFPSLFFLLSMEKRRLTWHRIREYVLLLSRMLTVGFLVLSFLHPSLPIPFLPEPVRNVYLDTSLSMGKTKEKGIPLPSRGGVLQFDPEKIKKPAVLITDLQRINFEKLKPVKGIRIKRIPLPSWNAGILDAFYTRGKLRVLCGMWGKSKSMEVKVFSGKRLLAKTRCYLREGKNMIEIPVNFQGRPSGYIVIEKDSLTFDDTLYFVFPEEKNIPVFLPDSGILHDLITSMGFRPEKKLNASLFILPDRGEEEYLRSLGLRGICGKKGKPIGKSPVKWLSGPVEFLNPYLEGKVIEYTEKIKGGKVLGMLEDGTPFVVEKDGVIYFPLPLDSSSLTFSPFFPPLIHSLLLYLAGEKKCIIRMDEPYIFDLPEKNIATVIAPDGRKYRVRKEEGRFVFRNTGKKGIYRVKDTDLIFAVNQLPEESDISVLSDEEAARIFQDTGRRDAFYLFLCLSLFFFLLSLLIERR